MKKIHNRMKMCFIRLNKILGVCFCICYSVTLLGQDSLVPEQVKFELLSNIRDLKSHYSKEDTPFLHSKIDSLQRISAFLVVNINKRNPSQDFLQNLNYNVHLLGRFNDINDSIKPKIIDAIIEDFSIKITYLDSTLAIDPTELSKSDRINFTIRILKNTGSGFKELTKEGIYQVVAMGITQDTSEIKIPPKIPFSYSLTHYSMDASLVVGYYIFYAIDPLTKKICSTLFPDKIISGKKEVVIYLN